MYICVNFTSQIVGWMGSLVPKIRDLIHQFDVWLDFWYPSLDHVDVSIEHVSIGAKKLVVVCVKMP